MKGEEKKVQPSPGNKVSSVGSVGFFSSPQAPRCGSAVSWASKRGFVDSLGDPPRLDLLPTWEWGGRGPCWGTYQGAGGPRRSEHSPRARGSALPIPTQAPHEPWSRAHRVPKPNVFPEAPSFEQSSFSLPCLKTEKVQTSTFCLKEIPAVTWSLTCVFSAPFLGEVWAGASEQRGRHAGGGLAVLLGEGLPAASIPQGSGDRPGVLREAWSQTQTGRWVGLRADGDHRPGLPASRQQPQTLTSPCFVSSSDRSVLNYSVALLSAFYSSFVKEHLPWSWGHVGVQHLHSRRLCGLEGMKATPNILEPPAWNFSLTLASSGNQDFPQWGLQLRFSFL